MASPRTMVSVQGKAVRDDVSKLSYAHMEICHFTPQGDSLVTRTEPPRVFRRLFCLSQAARSETRRLPAKTHAGVLGRGQDKIGEERLLL